MSSDAQNATVDYKDTLNLPRTDFPMRPQAKIDDPLLLERWEKEQLCETATQLHQGEKKFVLHVGPPYANGHIHLGHSYNWILKDIITKARRMAGYHVPVVPGWDCHGLPIEQKVMQDKPGITALAMKQACRVYAQQWVDVQKAEFKRLGIVMDWEHLYSTMSPEYEAATLRALAIMVGKGALKRSCKTVAWCASCMTTLASAEIEYQERKDPSIYVNFPLTAESCTKLGIDATHSAGLLVWTTTPWTLPLNRAVAIKPNTEYALVRIGEREVIIAAEAVPFVQKQLQVELVVLKRIAAAQLVGLCVEHPFIVGQRAPIIYDEMISTTEGTACVHVAPGCGPSDYELGVRNCLEIFSPISADGRYTQGILPAELMGMPLADGQGWVIRALEANRTLVHKGSIRHSYPHCWRCHNGLIFRATPQWFIDLHHDNLQENALAAIQDISFTPPQGNQFLRATVGSRWEWCVSRQRAWGVPIPAVICVNCDTALLRQDIIDKVADAVAREGIEYWERASLDEILVNVSCLCCQGTEWKKETDILDVWFDSGVSHFAVLAERADLSFPADLYLEGVDQYRGWFQSSLLTSLLISGKAPMRAIMSHGFTVDEKGQKMSKSLGNVVMPQQIIERIGTDGLRLWVSSIGQEGDIVVSEKLIENVAHVYRKIRNTCRFFLQNLYDFDPAIDALSYNELLFIDQIALTSFSTFHAEMCERYKAYDVTAVFHGLADYCTTQLSALYLDMVKDRLYVEAVQGRARRSAQTVLWHMLDALTRLIAPILSFTAEHIADHYKHPWQGSIHLQTFADLSPFMQQQEKHQMWWHLLVEIRAVIMKLLEEKRTAGLIKHSLQASVTLSFTQEYPQYAVAQQCAQAIAQSGSTLAEVLRDLCVVSELAIIEDTHGLSATERIGVYGAVKHAPGMKCARCWQWHERISSRQLCMRCEAIVTHLQQKPQSQ